ncbi:MAG: DNA mismatch repair protein MutH [Polyangiaceae bacterium]|nr:DNA mismatch repair protein MutH [Polyangiaceae bacterium]
MARSADPPRDTAELRARAAALEGLDVEALAARLGRTVGGPAVRTKGKVGELLERALGATAGTSSEPDFVELGVELKTIPVRPDGRVRESTFVSAFSLAHVDEMEWETSAVRRKLARVLWVPIVHADRRTIGRATLWSPGPEDERTLAADFDELIGRIAIGGIEGVDARVGEALQLRPKAADGTKRAVALGPDGERIASVPLGFYLRARFTERLLRAARAGA